MTRGKMIKKLMKMANTLMSHYSYKLENEIWGMCSDWNSEHPDEEIFMSETCDDNDNVNGFAIEDDVWYYEEER